MLDLSQLSKYKENNRLETKKHKAVRPHSIWETYSAFVNTFGSYILLGVVENTDKIANLWAFRINVQETFVGGVSPPRNELIIKKMFLSSHGQYRA